MKIIMRPPALRAKREPLTAFEIVLACHTHVKTQAEGRSPMNAVIYLIGLIVVVLAILNLAF